MFVPATLWDEFVPRFAAAAKAMKLSPALDYSADMGSLISRKQLDTITRHVEDAVGKGTTVLAGGNARPDLGPFFYEPTALTDVTEEMTACEIAGDRGCYLLWCMSEGGMRAFCVDGL